MVNDRMFWGYHHNFSIRLNSITSNVQNGTKCYVYLFSSLLTAQVFSRNSEQNVDAALVLVLLNVLPGNKYEKM